MYCDKGREVYTQFCSQMMHKASLIFHKIPRIIFKKICYKINSTLRRSANLSEISESCFHLSVVLTFRSSPVVISPTATAPFERRKVARSPQRAYSSTALSGSSREQTPTSNTTLACLSRDMTAVCRRNASLVTAHTHTQISRALRLQSALYGNSS